MNATHGTTAAARAHANLDMALEIEHAAFDALACEIADLVHRVSARETQRLRQLMAVYDAARDLFVSAAIDACEVLEHRQ